MFTDQYIGVKNQMKSKRNIILKVRRAVISGGWEEIVNGEGIHRGFLEHWQ